MIEEIFTDLAPLSDKRGVTLTAEGDGIMTGSDALIYRLDLQPDGERRQVRPAGRLGTGFCHSGVGKASAPRLRHRLRHSGGVSAQHLPALLPVDKSRSREYGGAGLGLDRTGDHRPPRRLRLGGEKFGEGHYHCGGVANATINEALKPFYSFFAASLAALLWGGQSKREASLFNLKFLVTYARVAQWWSIALPRRGSRVRIPSRARFLRISSVGILFFCGKRVCDADEVWISN